MTEILAPAGTMECALSAINAGADAIYLGYSNFSARANAGNFDSDGLRSIVTRTRLLGVKIYVALNTIIKTEELSSFLDTVSLVWSYGVDAIILQDLFLGKYIHEQNKEIVLHASTQAGVCNLSGALLAKEYGFSRVILARETPIEEVKKIAQVIETEAFVQGALCTAFSGQCYFSSFVGGNSGNRGRCKQPCRKKYKIGRKNYDHYAYALSLSDLSVGEKIKDLRKAGVVSFKIEGRMRRPEYVAAAVRYYRAILDGKENLSTELSDLKRTYNRGNYTQGLTFGQDKRLLSRSVQGHLGENVGTVKVVNGKYHVETKLRFQKGDAFKIFRKGEEVGGGVFEKEDRTGFFLSSGVRLLNGDHVFITTDTATKERLLSLTKTKEISLCLRFVEGEKAMACGGGIAYESEGILQSAKARPLTIEEAEACFQKIDGLPLTVSFEKVEIEGNIFIPKSQLNAFRRAFFEKLAEVKREEPIFSYAEKPREKANAKPLTAVIVSEDTDFENLADIVIFKPQDYTKPLPEAFLEGKYKKYIYCPPRLTSLEEERIASLVKENGLDGIYAETYSGIAFAKRENVSLFAGVGFHITNNLSLSILLKEGVDYYMISKEICEREQTDLATEKAFVLTHGDLKLMDLCYCPFEKKCYDCDKQKSYSLTDENGREFLLRRYVSPSGGCKFEVYNCSFLVGETKANVLVDVSATGNARTVLSAKTVEKQKKIFKSYTSGHAKNSVL